MRNKLILLALLVLVGGGAGAWFMSSSTQTGKTITVALEPESEAESELLVSGDPSGALPPIGNAVAADPLNADPKAAGAAAGEGLRLCEGEGATPPVGADGRLMNHFAYAEAAASDMVAPPKAFQSGNCQLVHRDMAKALADLIAAAKAADAAVGNAIMGVSCFRSVERQAGLFCNPAKLADRGYVGQAKWIAPPGYSEHATGLSLDFGARTIPGCHANPCFKDTRTGKWLRANASRFGFELSFPDGNAQGVNFEPWHFRYTGSPHAQSVFSAARAAFP